MPIKILLITRNGPKHFALIEALVETERLAGVILQREIDELPHEKAAATRFFGSRYTHTAKAETILIDGGNINSNITNEFIQKINPNIIIHFDAEDFNMDTNAQVWKIHEENGDNICHKLMSKTETLFQTSPITRKEDTPQDTRMRSLRTIINNMPNIVKNYCMLEI